MEYARNLAAKRNSCRLPRIFRPRYRVRMESPRLPRFERSTEVAPLELTERDREIIRLVNRHRFLRSTHLVSLLGGSSQQLLRRLQVLFHHGYLERPRCQLDFYYKTGSRPIVYGIGNKGAAILTSECEIPRERIRWGEKNRSVSRPFLEHALMVADVIVAIGLACRKNDEVFFIPSDMLLAGCGQKRFSWKAEVSQNLTLGVVPDAVFALEHNGGRAYFFLEADQGTMPVIRQNIHQTSMYRKFVSYEATWAQSIHQKQFGFHRFRVLMVTKSQKRVESLVAACSQLKSGKGLFLFADQTITEKPDDILSAVWRTGTGGTGSLLD